jgi:hypothetical protein
VAEFVGAVNYFYTHHMRRPLVAELAPWAAACEVIAKLYALGAGDAAFFWSGKIGAL